MEDKIIGTEEHNDENNRDGWIFKSTKNNDRSQDRERAVSQVQKKKKNSERIYAQAKERGLQRSTDDVSDGI